MATAIVSLDFKHLPLRALSSSLRLTLEDVGDLISFVDAYVLHDSIEIFHEDLPTAVGALAPSLDDVSLIERSLGEFISPVLLPFMPPDAQQDHQDLERALRLLRWPRNESPIGFPTGVPSRPRDPAGWLAANLDTPARFVSAELRYAEQQSATYHVSPDARQIVSTLHSDFGSSATAMLRAFETARKRQIVEVEKLLQPTPVAAGAPLLLAWAINSADTTDGFIAAVRDIRNSNDVAALRSLVARLATAEPKEQAKLARVIQGEFARALGAAPPHATQAAQLLQSLPSVLSGAASLEFASVLQAATRSASIVGRVDELIESLRVRRHLAIFRKAHRAPSSIRELHAGFTRVFGPPLFTEPELARWFAQAPGPPDTLTRAQRVRAKQLEKFTRNRLRDLNRFIVARSRALTEPVVGEVESGQPSPNPKRGKKGDTGRRRKGRR